MNRRERLRRCYYHQELDRPAVYSRCGFPENDPSYDSLKTYLRERTELKVTWRGDQFEPALPVETFELPHSADYVRVKKVLRTPRGDLEIFWLKHRRGLPGVSEKKYFITNRDEAERYQSLPLPEIRGDAGSFFNADRAIGDAGIVDVYLGLNPAGFVAQMIGSEQFAMLTATDRDVIHALCERQMRLMLRRVEWLLAQKVGPFFSMCGEEYVTPPLHGPQDFSDFNVKYDKPIIDLIHQAGGRMHIHCHGRIRKVFQGFLEMGADVLHPFEAPPMGDITAAEARARAGQRLCLEGNIQINRMYEAAPAAIRAETEALIKTAFTARQGLIVCPTASPYIPGKGAECLPQYRAMVEAVLAWKK